MAISEIVKQIIKELGLKEPPKVKPVKKPKPKGK